MRLGDRLDSSRSVFILFCTIIALPGSAAPFTLQTVGQVAVGANPFTIAFNPNDGLAYVNGRSGSDSVILKVDPVSVRTVGSFTLGAGNIEIDPVTNTLFATSAFGMGFGVIPIDLSTGTILSEFPLSCEPEDSVSVPSA